MKKENELLQEASNEIKSLRKQNELMGARLDMFDSMMLIFRTQPNYGSQGMSEDLVWKIDKHLEQSKQSKQSK